MPKQIHEAGAVATAPTAGGNMLVQIITPGEGSSGIYPAAVLEAAADAGVFPAGTPMFADHPSESEAFDRPERSIRDMAAVTVEDARWDGGALVAEARTFGPWTDVLAEMKDAIGVSIRATADVGEADKATGKPTINRLVEGLSIDFVTKAGRGGAIRQVYESARSKATTIVRDATNPANLPVLREATADDIRTALGAAVTDAYGAEKSWVWVRDFDPDASLAYFTVETPDGSALFQQSYTVADDGTASLNGERTEVNVRTEYVPAGNGQPAPTDDPAPAGQSTANESRKGNTMATTQIEEAELGRLREDSQRVQTAESERDAANTRAEESDRHLVEAHRQIDRGHAQNIVRAAAHEAGVTLDDYQVAGIAADYPVKDGRIDTDKLAESAKTAVARLAEAGGAGQVRGFGGGTSGGDQISESDARDFLYGTKGA